MNLTSRLRLTPNITLAVLAIAAGAAAFWLTRDFLAENAEATRERLERRFEMRAVVVAARDLPAGHVLVASDLARRDMPAGFLPGATLEPPQRGDALGRRLLTPLAAGDALVQGALEPRHAPSLAQRLDRGTRAVTVPVDQVSSQAGLVRPGDRVDLMVAEERVEREGRCVVVRPLLEALRVLATGQATRDPLLAADARSGQSLSPDTSYSTMTFDVTPEQGQVLAAGLRLGELIPMLRGAADDAPTGLGAQGAGHEGCRAGQAAGPRPAGRSTVAIDLLVGSGERIAWQRRRVPESDL
jgi:pilus assembly protein CpaB